VERCWWDAAAAAAAAVITAIPPLPPLSSSCVPHTHSSPSAPLQAPVSRISLRRLFSLTRAPTISSTRMTERRARRLLLPAFSEWCELFCVVRLDALFTFVKAYPVVRLPVGPMRNG
jgi:hypothetical protein